MFIQTKSSKITGVIAFTILYTLGFVTFHLSRESYSALPSLGMQSFLAVLVSIAHKRVHYSRPLLWNLSILGFLNLAGGSIALPASFGAEGAACILNEFWVIREWVSYSSCIHLYGFAVVAWMSWQALCKIIHSRYQRRLMPSSGLLILVVTSAIGYGVISEIIFHLANLCFIPESIVDYSGVYRNMVASTCGALLASAIIKLRNL